MSLSGLDGKAWKENDPGVRRPAWKKVQTLGKGMNTVSTSGIKTGDPGSILKLVRDFSFSGP
jgi:hypothetical protein